MGVAFLAFAAFFLAAGCFAGARRVGVAFLAFAAFFLVARCLAGARDLAAGVARAFVPAAVFLRSVAFVFVTPRGFGPAAATESSSGWTSRTVGFAVAAGSAEGRIRRRYGCWG